MNLITNCCSRASPVPFSPITTSSCGHFHRPSFLPSRLSFPVWTCPSVNIPNKSLLLHARKKRSDSDQKILEPTIIEEVSLDDEDDTFVDDLEDDEYMNDDDDDYFDEYDTTEAELYAGDGAGGGGISLAGTWWDKKALEIAEEVTSSFDGNLKIYAFKTLSNSTIQVRIERLTNKSGSPDMEDIQAFSTTYRARLDEAELAKSIPENVSLEVSSPGVERVVRVPNELDRFKDRNMYVKYISEIATTGSSSESDGVFRLVSFDIETKCCTWGLADVRVNREKAGKGRPLSKKQREWRLDTPFDSLRLVRLYSGI